MMGDARIAPVETPNAGGFAALLPLATFPLALAMLCAVVGMTPPEVWQRGGLWMGALAIVTVFGSILAAQLIAASLARREAPAALALLPLAFPGSIALFGTASGLAAVFGYSGTFCGPATREVVIAGSLSEVMLFRVAALCVACAGVTSVALAMALASERLDTRVRWATTLSAAVLGLSLANAAFAAATVQRLLPQIAQAAPAAGVPLLFEGLERWRDHASAANALLLSSLVFGLRALLYFAARGESPRGVATMVALIAMAIGSRGVTVLDEKLMSRAFDEEPLFEFSARVIEQSEDDPEFVWPRHVFQSSIPVAERISRALADAREWEADPVAPPGMTIPRRKVVQEPAHPNLPFGFTLPVPTRIEHLQEALWALRNEGVSDLELFTPVGLPRDLPRAFRPVTELVSSLHVGTPLSVRFVDEVVCVTTTDILSPLTNTARGGRGSAWDLPCETIGLREITAEGLAPLARATLASGSRLVVLVPRSGGSVGHHAH